jgi:nicotinate-nucleotide adenylyltransferase
MGKVGLFGGTFDPIHRGHLEMAGRARTVFGLDRIWFIPARIPPHKDASGVSDPYHRYAMVALATQDNRWFVPSALELRSEGTSYTIRTVSRVRELLGPGVEIYFLMGMDSWREIETWKDYRQLLDSCSIILLPRGGSEGPAASGPDVIDVRDTGGDDPLDLPQGPAVFSLLTGEVEVSSTTVREKAARGESLSGFVPESVERYMEKHSLYGMTGAAL